MLQYAYMLVDNIKLTVASVDIVHTMDYYY